MTEAVIETGLSASQVESIEVGDVYRRSGHDMATIESIQVFPTNNPERYNVYIGLKLRTDNFEEDLWFGGKPIRLGSIITFTADDYSLTGNIVHIGGTSPPGEIAEVSIRIRMDNVDPERVDSVQEGMTETVLDRSTARITGKQTEPATVVVQTQEGELLKREHPVNQDVTLTVTLEARRINERSYFHGEPLLEGGTIRLDLGTTIVEGSIADIA